MTSHRSLSSVAVCAALTLLACDKPLDDLFPPGLTGGSGSTSTGTGTTGFATTGTGTTGSATTGTGTTGTGTTGSATTGTGTTGSATTGSVADAGVFVDAGGMAGTTGGPLDGGLDAGEPDANPGDGGSTPDAIAPDAITPDSSADDASLGDGDVPDPSVRPSAACTSDGAGAGTQWVSVTVDDADREYLLHVPPSGGGAPRPLVLALHGYTMDAEAHEDMTGLSELSDQEGFAVVYPEGLGDASAIEAVLFGQPSSGWNAGACCAYESPLRDDVAFMNALLDHVGETLCVDLNRVYATGFSNGGMMTYRLICELSDRVAAAASVSGSAVIPLEGCQPAHPMPLMHTHGDADGIVPYEGGDGPDWLTPAGETPPTFPSAREQATTMASLNACSMTPVADFDNGEAFCERYTDCTDDADVLLCTIDGGGHAWPGGGPQGVLDSLFLGYQSSDLPTSQKMWEFLEQHHLR